MNSDRMEQVNELVLRQLAIIIQKELPQFFVSITKCEVSRDLAHAKIWVSEISNTDGAAKELNREGFKLRKVLAGKVKLRKIPSLHFISDNTEKKADHIEKLLSEIKQEENA